MQVLITQTLTADQEQVLDRLWDEEYPQNLAGRYRLLLEGASRYQHHLLLDESGGLAGWAVEFDKEGETRFSIIVPAARQGRGFGTLLLDSLKAGLDECYGWVIDHDRDVRSDGQPYRSPLPFYKKQGFEVLTGKRIESDLISAVKVRWCSRRSPSG